MLCRRAQTSSWEWERGATGQVHSRSGILAAVWKSDLGRWWVRVSGCFTLWSWAESVGMEGWGGGDRLEAGGEPGRTPWLVWSRRRECWVSSLVKGGVRILPKREDAGDLGVEGLSESQWDQQGVCPTRGWVWPWGGGCVCGLTALTHDLWDSSKLREQQLTLFHCSDSVIWLHKGLVGPSSSRWTFSLEPLGIMLQRASFCYQLQSLDSFINTSGQEARGGIQARLSWGSYSPGAWKQAAGALACSLSGGRANSLSGVRVRVG